MSVRIEKYSTNFVVPRKRNEISFKSEYDTHNKVNNKATSLTKNVHIGKLSTLIYKVVDMLPDRIVKNPKIEPKILYISEKLLKFAEKL